MNGLRRVLGDGVEAAGRRLGAGEPGVLPVVVGVLVIWSVFQLLNGNFLAPRNLSNLGVDIVGTGMIAVGVVFVLLIGEIDLSVGSVSGLAAALFAVLHVRHGVAEWPAVAIAVLCGTAIGSLHGLLVALVGAPAFVVTLAGLLGWNGLMLYALGAGGTVNLDEDGLLGGLTGHHFHEVAAAYGLAAAGTVLCFLVFHRDRRRRRAAGMPHRRLAEIAVRTGAVALVAFSAAHVLNRFQGLPLALLAFLLVVAGFDLVLRRTRYGRKVYALGGGGEPARRAGIDVVRVRVSVFALSGTMAAVGGLFLASRITSVSQTSGSSLLLMNAIAAAVIGGTSLFGGRGTTWSALLGMLVIQSIASGMSLLGIEAAVQFMVTGGVLLAAVVVDTVARRVRREHGRA